MEMTTPTEDLDLSEAIEYLKVCAEKVKKGDSFALNEILDTIEIMAVPEPIDGEIFVKSPVYGLT